MKTSIANAKRYKAFQNNNSSILIPPNINSKNNQKPPKLSNNKLVTELRNYQMI